MNNILSKDVHVLISRACDCITVQSERNFADINKLRILRWGDDVGLSRLIIQVGLLIQVDSM